MHIRTRRIRTPIHDLTVFALAVAGEAIGKSD
jgi:hypothetical protein